MVVIPNGTLNRWDVISIWMSEHGAQKEREGKMILKKAKELEKSANRGPMDAQEAFKKYQEQQDKKKMEGKKNTAEAAEASAAVSINSMNSRDFLLISTVYRLFSSVSDHKQCKNNQYNFRRAK